MGAFVGKPLEMILARTASSDSSFTYLPSNDTFDLTSKAHSELNNASASL